MERRWCDSDCAEGDRASTVVPPMLTFIATRGTTWPITVAFEDARAFEVVVTTEEEEEEEEEEAVGIDFPTDFSSNDTVVAVADAEEEEAGEVGGCVRKLCVRGVG